MARIQIHYQGVLSANDQLAALQRGAADLAQELASIDAALAPEIRNRRGIAEGIDGARSAAERLDGRMQQIHRVVENSVRAYSEAERALNGSVPDDIH